MRSNAIIRILIWSIVILVLTGILIAGLAVGGLFAVNLRETDNTEIIQSVTPVAESTAAVEVVPVTEPLETQTAYVQSGVVIYSSPDENDRKSVFGNSSQVTFHRSITVSGKDWVYITDPAEGWVLRSDLDTEPPIAVTPAETSITAIVRETADLYSVPTVSGTPTASLDENVTVSISRVESINGSEWAYITSPDSGWVEMKHLEQTEPSDSIPETTPSTIPETTSPPASPESIQDEKTIDASAISEISIDWAAGNILIEPGDSENIVLWEEGCDDEKYAMELKQKQGKLSIAYCEASILRSFGILNNSEKNLVIQIPSDWTGTELEIDAGAANVEILNQRFREVDIDTASGVCLFNSCTIGELDMDAASGDVEFIGELNVLELDAASANFRGELTSVPSRIEIDSMSGSLELVLPADAGFSLNMNGLKSNFYSDFPTTVRNGRYICGSGACLMDVNVMSGDVTLYRRG